MNLAKNAINKTVNKMGYRIIKKNNPDFTYSTTENSRNKSPSTEKKQNPSDYSTTDDPQEVPCQKVVYYHALNNYINDYSKVLDVGCGLGYGMAIMSVKADEVHGVDVDSKAVRRTKLEYLGNNPKIKSITKYNGYQTPFADNSFDAVTCIDVIEHVEDYHKFIKELLRVSKKYVIISTPNQRPEFTNEDGTPKNHWHLREWKPKELQSIIAKHASSASVEWFYIDGPFEGPFKINKRPGVDTLVLMPVLKKSKK